MKTFSVVELTTDSAVHFSELFVFDFVFLNLICHFYFYILIFLSTVISPCLIGFFVLIHHFVQ